MDFETSQNAWLPTGLFDDRLHAAGSIPSTTRDLVLAHAEALQAQAREGLQALEALPQSRANIEQARRNLAQSRRNE